MDNGQPINPFNQEPFFTAGVGNAPETKNPDEANSLDSNNYNPNHDLRNIGNTAIVSPGEQGVLPSEISLENQAPDGGQGQLGQIVNLETPSNNEQTTAIQPASTNQVPETSSKNDKSIVQAAKSLESEFFQTGDASKFYTEAQDERVSKWN